MNDTLCISLKTLYEQKGPNLKYGTYIRKQIESGKEYYDLLEAPPECGTTGIIMCDGECCKILRATNDQILLRSEDYGQTFCLTKEEFEIASFLCNEQEMVLEKAKTFCKEVALHLAYNLTELHANRLLLDNGKKAKLYESPTYLLCDLEEVLIADYSERGTDWNDVVEFIHKSIKKDKIDGIRHAHVPDGDQYWSVSHSIDQISFWLGRYKCLLDAILAKRSFLYAVSKVDSETKSGIDLIAEMANEMVQQSLDKSTKTMTPEMLSSKLLAASCLEFDELIAYCRVASEMILDQQDTIDKFVKANELLHNNPAYQKYLEAWRKENNQDNLTYPSGDQVYKDWELLRQLVKEKGKC